MIGLLASAIGARATPIYNSIGAGGGSVSLTNQVAGTYANSFHTDSTGVLSEIEIALQKNNGSFSSGSVVVTLWSDNGQGLSGGLSGATASDGPGQLVATIGRVRDADIATTSAKWLVDLYNIGLTLSPDTQYWIALSRVGSDQTAIKGLTSAVLPTLGATYKGDLETYYHGGKSNLVFPELQVCVSADGSCTVVTGPANLSFNVPEPTGVAILASALAGLGYVTAYRHRKQQASL